MNIDQAKYGREVLLELAGCIGALQAVVVILRIQGRPTSADMIEKVATNAKAVLDKASGKVPA